MPARKKRSLQPGNNSPRKIKRRKTLPNGRRSKFTGVVAASQSNKWRSYRKIDGDNVYNGSYEKEEDAARASDEIVRKHKLWLMNLNFPKKGEIEKRRKLKMRETKSGYIHVRKVSPSGKWRAQIKLHGRNIYGAIRDTKLEAAMEADRINRKQGGEYYLLNFPTPSEMKNERIELKCDESSEEDGTGESSSDESEFFEQSDSGISRNRSRFSKFAGVYWEKKMSRWRVARCKNGVTKHGGYFKSQRKAARASDELIRKNNYWTPWTKLNFPEEGELEKIRSKKIEKVSLQSGAYPKRRLEKSNEALEKEHMVPINLERDAMCMTEDQWKEKMKLAFKMEKEKAKRRLMEEIEKRKRAKIPDKNGKSSESESESISVSASDLESESTSENKHSGEDIPSEVQKLKATVHVSDEHIEEIEPEGDRKSNSGNPDSELQKELKKIRTEKAELLRKNQVLLTAQQDLQTSERDYRARIQELREQNESLTDFWKEKYNDQAVKMIEQMKKIQELKNTQGKRYREIRQEEDSRLKELWSAKVESEKMKNSKLREEIDDKKLKVQDLERVCNNLMTRVVKLEQEKNDLMEKHEEKEKKWDDERQALISMLP